MSYSVKKMEWKSTPNLNVRSPNAFCVFLPHIEPPESVWERKRDALVSKLIWRKKIVRYILFWVLFPTTIFIEFILGCLMAQALVNIGLNPHISGILGGTSIMLAWYMSYFTLLDWVLPTIYSVKHKGKTYRGY